MIKLDLIRRLELPPDLFDHTPIQELERYRQRVAVEASFELRRHPEPQRLTWLAAFAYVQGRAITDSLVDLLIETIHHIGARAERKVERELLEDLKRVTGKQTLLFELADAALAHPEGIVREVVFPVVGEQTLRDLVREWKATGPTYRTTLRTVIRNSYSGHYRQVVPQLIAEAWPMTSLLDMLKETDLRLNFTDALRSPTSYETFDRAILRPRLLLCLHGIGTNAGLQRMNAAQHGATYKMETRLDLSPNGPW